MNVRFHRYTVKLPAKTFSSVSSEAQLWCTRTFLVFNHRRDPMLGGIQFSVLVGVFQFAVWRSATGKITPSRLVFIHSHELLVWQRQQNEG